MYLEVTSITLNNGEQYKIPIDFEGVVFKSNNTDVVVVSPNGTVTAIGEGIAIISIIDKDYNTLQLKNTVKPTGSIPVFLLGDVNKNGVVDAVDTSSVLAYYAMTSTNRNGGYDEQQKLAADVNIDMNINAVDASNILAYYAYVAITPEGEAKTMEEYMKK